MQSRSTIHVTTAQGLGPFLRDEVSALGYTPLWAGTGDVEIEGTFADTLKLNLHLRTAHHVLYMIGRAQCGNADQLYRFVNALPWEKVIAPDGYLSVVSKVSNPTIRDSRFANVRCKDAIVDRLSTRKGRRPDSGPDRSKTVVNLYWREDRCVVYLDTSGEPLSKRGYRKIPLKAPMQETLAAGVVAASHWKPRENFVNPMCGSGTIAIEAALLATSHAPGLTRGNFGFMHTLLYDRTVWRDMVAAARTQVRSDPATRIIASDNDRTAVDAARMNAEAAGVLRNIEFEACDFTQSEVPDGGGVVVLNPEHGVRLGDEAKLEATYKRIGEFFKKRCQGYRGYIFTSNPKLAGRLGLKSRRHVELMSGQIAARLYEYDLYPGRRPQKA